MDAGGPAARGWDALAPLREPTFRTIWSASLLSNFGQLILGVGAAWEMTRLANSADMVALVQTAMMIPLMLVSVPAGAVADMYDRRKIALLGLGIAALCATLLATISATGNTTPWLLLVFCSLIGAGVSLYGPAWQASVGEQVGPDQLPAAVALGAISYNLARSFGPAIGGAVVLALGATGAFAINALCYIPLLLAFLLWRRERAPSRLPPERIDRAIVSGARYAIYAPPVRTVMIRSLLFGLASAAGAALPALVARDLLQGNATTYGLLLGASGVGAVAGALMSSRVRERLPAEHAMRLCAIVGGLGLIGVGLSSSVWLTCLLLAIAGVFNMVTITMLNVGVQLAVPRWVTARALALYVSALAGGIAVGSWAWGLVADDMGVATAYYCSGVALMLTPLAGLVLPMPTLSVAAVQTVEFPNEPEVALAITNRSGPVIIELEYRVEPEQARQFYNAMLKVQEVRQKNGAFEWSISRDIGDAHCWIERYSLPTWGDYLRHRSSFTEADREVQAAANAFHQGGETGRVRRRLERPFGSVRWRAETPDPQGDILNIFP